MILSKPSRTAAVRNAHHRPARSSTALHTFTAFAGAAALALWCIAAAQAQPNRSGQRVLLVNQTVTGPETGAVSSISARVGTLAFGPGGLRSDRSVEPLSQASVIAQASVRDFGSNLSQRQIIAQASTDLAGQVGSIAAALRRALQVRGLTQASFVFDQRVSIAGAARPMQLVWTLGVDSTGRSSFASPRLFDTQPSVLHAQYVPLRVAQGLPQGWAYPDAGQLRWQLLNLQMQPIGPITTVDTGGAFDPPDDTGGTPVDPESGLRCLVDRTARPDCPAGLPDLISLIDQNSAASALLDYSQRLAPVYDAVAGSPGEVEQIARMSMQVDIREVTYGDCSADMSYRNAGQYGFTLLASSDRYTVQPDGRYARLNRRESTLLSPTQRYDFTWPLRPIAASELATLILDPADPSRPLLPASDIRNLLFLAPVTITGGGNRIVANYTSPVSGATRLQLDIGCSAQGTWRVRSTIAPWARCHGGNCNSDYFAYEADFVTGRAEAAPARTTAVSYRGIAWETQQVTYDGARTFTFWHAPAFGCSATIGAQFSLSGEFLGVLGFVPCPPADPPDS